MKYGFVKAAAAVPTISVADCTENASSIISIIGDAAKAGTELLLLPELCVTSCSCGELYTHPHLLASSIEALKAIAATTDGKSPIVVAGTPLAHKNSVYNTAAVIYNGKIAAFVAKKRTSYPFTSGDRLPAGATANIDGTEVPIVNNAIFSTPFYTFAVEVGNDAHLPLSPGAQLATEGAQIILNPANGEARALSTSHEKRRIEEFSHRCSSCYIHAASGWGESTSNSVHSGYSAIAEEGSIIAEGKPFTPAAQFIATDVDCEKTTKQRRGKESFSQPGTAVTIHIPQKENSNARLTRTFSPTPFLPSDGSIDTYCEEIFTLQATALARRLVHTGSKSCVIGISGGLDSTLALLAAAKACDIAGKPHSDITAVTMPGFGTSGRTYGNAHTLMQSIGTTIREISIKEACIQHFKDIGHNTEVHDVTYENAQARERTQILMDIANQENGIVIGTGDLSELALGWATYNGDHMSMYSLNATIPKTLVRQIVHWVARNESNKEISKTLIDIIETPVSPELVPTDDKGNIAQKTEDLVGPYELHDFFIYHFTRYGYSPEKIFAMAERTFAGSYSKETIKKWLTTFFRRFFTQQFKRSCMPDGPDTGFCSLNPATGWKMTSDTSHSIWSQACEKNI